MQHQELILSWAKSSTAMVGSRILSGIYLFLSSSSHHNDNRSVLNLCRLPTGWIGRQARSSLLHPAAGIVTTMTHRRKRGYFLSKTQASTLTNGLWTSDFRMTRLPLQRRKLLLKWGQGENFSIPRKAELHWFSYDLAILLAVSLRTLIRLHIDMSVLLKLGRSL